MCKGQYVHTVLYIDHILLRLPNPFYESYPIPSRPIGTIQNGPFSVATQQLEGWATMLPQHSTTLSSTDYHQQ